MHFLIKIQTRARVENYEHELQQIFHPVSLFGYLGHRRQIVITDTYRDLERRNSTLYFDTITLNPVSVGSL